MEEQEKYLDHVIINVAERKIEMYSDHGDYKEVCFKWDSDGYEGFTDTWQSIAKNVPDDMYTVKL